MALEDICNFNCKLSSLKNATTFQMPCDVFDLGLRRSTESQAITGAPMYFSKPLLSNSTSSLFTCSDTAKPSVTVHRPFPLSHGTTTLGFIFQGGVIAAADTRASAGGLVACPAVHKITPVHSHLVVTSSGSGADCMLWERILIREIRLYQLRHKRRLSIRGTAKLLSFMLHPFKGTDVCVALTLCGWDKETGSNELSKQRDPSANSDQCVSGLAQSVSTDSGPKLIYVCSDGVRLQGDVFSVGSGSPYAYSVIDGDLKWSLSVPEAVSLAREAVFRATHRDAYSGNNVDLFHITAQGWHQRKREDLKEEYYRKTEENEKKVEERKLQQIKQML